MVLTRSNSAAGKRRRHHVSLPYAPSRKRSKVGSASRRKEPALPLSDPIVHDTANESDLIVTAQEGNHEPHDPVAEKLKDDLWKTTISPGDIEVSFGNFPYYLSETTKNALISSAYVSLKCPNFTKRKSKLAAVSPRMLLSGSSNCEIYKETLVKALAKYFDARLLILDLLSLCDSDSYKPEKSVENEQRNPQASTDTPSSSRPSHPIDLLIHESSSSGTEAGPLIIYMKRTGQSCLQIARETFKALEAGVEKFRKNTLLIGSYIQISGAEKPKLGGFQFLMTGSNSTATTHLKNCSVCSQETGEETLNLLNELKKLFPHEMSIQRPQDETLFDAWKKQLASDVEIINAQSNVASIRSVLHKNGMDCVELETICVKDQILARDNVEQIVGWATSHDLRHNSDVSHDQDKIVVSCESIQHGLQIVQNMKNEKKGVKKSIKDVVTGNEFEKKILNDVISPKDIGIQFDDIGSLEEVKRTLKELVMLPLQRPELFSKGKLVKPCKGILLFGPPGTGKTMLAKAVATEAGANFINVSMPSINSKWLGEGEKAVKALFTLASKLAPAIIFNDEVDSMLGRRKCSGEHEENRKMKNEFMMNWDGLGTKENERILVLAATNRPFDLDEAVIRRLPRRLMVNFPDAQNREKILKVLLAKEEMSPDVDLHAIANMTEGYSGSDLKNMCVTAAHRPIRELIENEEKEKNLALAENRAPPDPLGSKDVRLLNMDDLKSAHQQVCASVSSHTSDLNELNKWNELYGEGGSKKQQKQLSYYI